MKKIYQAPTAEVIRIESSQKMLAASAEQIGFGNPVDNASGADARGLFLDGEY